MASEKEEAFNTICKDAETCLQDDFYIFIDASNLAAKCRERKEKITKCRTIGVLSSVNGVYYLDCLNLPKSKPIQVSMINMTQAPPPVARPCPVQVFGEMIWKCGAAVLLPKIVKTIPASLAIKLNITLNEMLRDYSVH